MNESDGKKTPLHVAVIEGQISNLLLMVQNRANVNAQDENMSTPMHYASLLGRVNCATVLFKNGAKLDIKDNKGELALDVAINHQKADCVTFLRLASLALTTEGTIDDSFMEALQNFSQEASNQEDQ